MGTKKGEIMPKVKYTSAKGLVQSPGSDMVLEGFMNGQKQAQRSVTSTATLTVEDSGKLITLTGTAFTLSLPSVSAASGCHYTILVGAANDYVLSELVGTDDNVLTMVSANATATERDHAFTTATLSAGAIGDRFFAVSNGTWWVITAFANAAINAA
jgi:hypothetical protein